MRELVAKKSTKEIKELFKLDIEEQMLKKILQVYVVDGRIKFFKDLYNDHKYLFEAPKYKPELLVFKKSNKIKTLKGLKLAEQGLENLKNWAKIEAIKSSIHKVVNDNTDLSFGDVFWPVRVALSGRENSPSPEELLWILDKEESQTRIKKALASS